MNTYTLVSGETLTHPDPAPAVADFLARLRIAAADPNVSVDQITDLVFGLENPLLDRTFLPGRAMVTREVFTNPVYHVMKDQIDVKRIQLGLLDPVVSDAKYTISVPEAAERLGITASAVRAAISAKRLSAIFRAGQWWIRPEALASYRASSQGPKRMSAARGDAGPGNPGVPDSRATRPASE